MNKPYTNDSFEQAKLVNPNRRVQVYKNLHKDVYSVKQDGIVRFHANNVWLKDVRFNVAPAGRERVRKEKKKNVHATVSGYIRTEAKNCNFRVSYNPYKHDQFMLIEAGYPIFDCNNCNLNKFGVWA